MFVSFKVHDIKVTHGSTGRKKVIEGKVPTVFESKSKKELKGRKPPMERESVIAESSTEESIIESDTENVEMNVENAEYTGSEQPQLSETDLLHEEISRLKKRIEDLCLMVQYQTKKL